MCIRVYLIQTSSEYILQVRPEVIVLFAYDIIKPLHV